jgi:hypothetical protein
MRARAAPVGAAHGPGVSRVPGASDSTLSGEEKRRPLGQALQVWAALPAAALGLTSRHAAACVQCALMSPPPPGAVWVPRTAVWRQGRCCGAPAVHGASPCGRGGQPALISAAARPLLCMAEGSHCHLPHSARACANAAGCRCHVTWLGDWQCEVRLPGGCGEQACARTSPANTPRACTARRGAAGAPRQSCWRAAAGRWASASRMSAAAHGSSPLRRPPVFPRLRPGAGANAGVSALR